MNGSDPTAQDAVDHTQVVGNMIVHTAGRRPAPVKVSAGQVLVAGFAGATVVGLDHSTDGAPATSSKIVFTRHGAPPQLRAFSGLHAINADGSNQTQLTHGYMDSNPAWSPDGTQVAFSRVTPGRWDEWGTRQLFRMRADGPGVVALTRQRSGAGSINPTWSPDAAQIVFERPGAARTADGHTLGGQLSRHPARDVHGGGGLAPRGPRPSVRPQLVA